MEAPKKSAPSLAPLGAIRPKEIAKVPKVEAPICSNTRVSSVPQKTTIQKSLSLPSKEEDEETASEDEDDLDAVPKRPKFQLSAQLPLINSTLQPSAPPSTSIFAKHVAATKTADTSSAASTSIFNNSTKVKAIHATSSTASKPSEGGGSSLAEIRRKLREKRLRKQETEI